MIERQFGNAGRVSFGRKEGRKWSSKTSATEIETCQGLFSTWYILYLLRFLVFCFLFRPSASENKPSLRPMAAQLDQHSSPSKYTKPAAEHANMARVETKHILCCTMFVSMYLFHCCFCHLAIGLLIRAAGRQLRQWPLEDHRGTAGVLHQSVQELAARFGRPHPG